MKKKHFDIIVIISIAVFLGTLMVFDLVEKFAKFMVIPMLAIYFIGQYSERRFRNE